MNNIQKIKVTNSTGVDSLKASILVELRLYDYKKKCEHEFEERITNYLKRNKELTLYVVVDHENIKKGIRTHAMHKFVKSVYPKDYRFDLPNMATTGDVDPKSKEQNKEEQDRVEAYYASEYAKLLSEVEKLNTIDRFSIEIKN
ncbi:hypothetical protein [Aquimarina mytili]|uniref:Uncharacterized protein n=1 Tax=Aquimarina mytili TaxID=874423 RepID=A0A936ZN59_9FLAO|nr:hypothetical protein [Aquimarina mytili]MBL0682694.1 hypothetical protein [Aquimarina mytili]